MRKSYRTKRLEGLIKRMLNTLDKLGNSQYAKIDARVWHELHRNNAINLGVIDDKSR